MRQYLKLNLVGSNFWQTDKDNSYIKKNYESQDELLDNIFFEVLPSGIFKEVTTGNALIVKSDDNACIDYPRGVEVSMSNFMKSNSLEIRSTLLKIKEAKLEIEYRTILDELLVKSQQCELVCDKKKSKEKELELK